MKKLFLAAVLFPLSIGVSHAEIDHTLPTHGKTFKKVQNEPSSVYMNGLGYFADRDPATQEPTIQDFVIANFNSHNRVQWENTNSHDLFTLIKIDNPVYDENGVIVSGDLHWGKQAFN